MIELKDLKASDLDGAFIELNDVTMSGNAYIEGGSGSMVFGVKEGNIYKIDPQIKEQHDDPTKGQLVVTVSDDTIRWRQEHELGNIYAKQFLAESKFTGDAGIPMMQALHNYLAGTFNIYVFDVNIKMPGDIVNKLIIDGKVNDHPEVKVTTNEHGASVQVNE